MLLFARTQPKGLQEMTTRWMRIRLTLNRMTIRMNVNMSDVGESDNEEISQHSETITLRGVSIHIEFQNTISRLSQIMMKIKMQWLWRFFFKVIGNQWAIYIPGNKVPKVQAALTNLMISSSMFPLL